MAKVDVVIPAYNVAKFLSHALNSVVTQSFTDWRIILVDDGSIDETSKIAYSYKRALGPKMEVIQQENRGVSAARNRAIRHSDAEYVALLDGDDLWLPQRLEESVKAMTTKSGTGISYGRIRRIDQHGNGLEYPFMPGLEGDIAAQIYSREVHLPAPTVTFRRACISEVGGFDESMRATEDRDLWFRIASKHSVRFIDSVIAHYRVSPTQATSDPEKMLRGQLTFLNRYRGSRGCGQYTWLKGLSGAYRECSEVYRKRGESSRAFRHAIRAFFLNPLEKQNVGVLGRAMLELAGHR